MLAFLATAGFSQETRGVQMPEKIAPDLAEKFAGNVASKTAVDTSTDVIVQYRESSGKQTQTMRARRADLYRLAADPEVEYITPDRVISASTVSPWEFMNAIGYPYENRPTPERPLFTGKGIGVAVIDSGITPDRYFLRGNTSVCATDLIPNDRIVYNQNFVTTESTSTDQYGHGTHVAGILGGNGDCLGVTLDRLSGVANEVNLINLRVLDRRGEGRDSWVIAAINRAIELRTQLNIRVINLSLGRPIRESYRLDPVCQAVERAWKAGIVVVVAAGNAGRDNSKRTNGYGTIGSPGNDPYVITVGATRMIGTSGPGDDILASYSSKGPTQIDHIAKPDLVAPGNLIASRMIGSQYLVSTFVANRIAVKISNVSVADVFELSGTSMAAPIVSGAAALLIEQNPSLNPSQIKARLMKSAFKRMVPAAAFTDSKTKIRYSINHDLFSIGAGYLDLKNALLRTWDTPPATRLALSPWVSETNGRLRVRYDYPNLGSSLVWGDSLVWGESLVWGDAVIKNGAPVGSSSLVWGDSTQRGFGLVWGDSLIWGDNSNKVFDESVSVQGDR